MKFETSQITWHNLCDSAHSIVLEPGLSSRMHAAYIRGYNLGVYIATLLREAFRNDYGLHFMHNINFIYG